MSTLSLDPARTRIIAALSVIALSGCWRDGVVDPNGENALRPLASFRGKAVFPDSGQKGGGLPADRLLHLRNLRIALVWQFTGVRSYKDTYSQSVMRAEMPFEFSGSLLQPPPQEFFESDEVAIGSIWMYSDADGTGTLDRLIHPEMEAKNRIIDSLARIASELKKEVADLSITRETPENVSDIYWLGGFGTILAPDGAGIDTLWVGKSEAEKDLWTTYLGSRYRILAAMTGWERFFSLRKKVEDRKVILKPSRDFAYEVEYHHKRRRYPKPGKEREFEAALRKATLADMQVLLFHEDAQRMAYLNGWLDYPYLGFDEPGADWVFGRSRRFHILYFESQAALDEFLAGERSSSFRIDGLERFHTGYNLVNCDEQYRCEPLSWKEEIEVELGWSETFFNPPSSPVQKPVIDPPQTAPSALFDTVGLGGAYDYLSYRPICVVLEGGHLWADIPDIGLTRLEAYDSTRFYSPIGEVQAEFLPGSRDWPRKLVLYFRNTTAAAVRDTGDRFRDDLARARAEVDSLRSLISTAKPYAGGLRGTYRFDFRKDTLALEFPSNGTGEANLRMPGIVSHALLALDDSDFISPAADIRIALRGLGEGVSYAVFSRQGKESRLPRFGSAAGMPLDSAGTVMDTLFASEGDREYSSPGIDGKPRFGCSGDGKFSAPGHGWLSAAAPSDSADPVPFQSAGQTLVWKIPAAAAKTAGLGLRICSEQAGMKGRMLVEFRGGSNPEHLTTFLGGPYWVDIQGGEGLLATGPVDIPDGPFYIGLVAIPTADDPFRFAVDGYWVRGE